MKNLTSVLENQRVMPNTGSPLFIKPGKKQQSMPFKFAEVKSHLRLWKCKKLPQTYCKLADLRLRNRV